MGSGDARLRKMYPLRAIYIPVLECINATLCGKTEKGSLQHVIKYPEIGRVSWIIGEAPKAHSKYLYKREAEKSDAQSGEARKKMEQKMGRDSKMLTSEVRSDAATSQGGPAAARAETKFSPRAFRGSAALPAP